MPRNDVFAEIAPCSNRSLAFVARYCQTSLIALLSFHIHLDIQDHNRAQESHALLRHGKQLRTVFVEFYPLHRRIEVPHFDAFARSDVPQPDGVVGGATGEEGGAGVDVDGPEGALVAMVGA